VATLMSQGPTPSISQSGQGDLLWTLAWTAGHSGQCHSKKMMDAHTDFFNTANFIVSCPKGPKQN
jgi:hypothetical protein